MLTGRGNMRCRPDAGRLVRPAPRRVRSHAAHARSGRLCIGLENAYGAPTLASFSRSARMLCALVRVACSLQSSDASIGGISSTSASMTTRTFDGTWRDAGRTTHTSVPDTLLLSITSVRRPSRR